MANPENACEHQISQGPILQCQKLIDEPVLTSTCQYCGREGACPIRDWDNDEFGEPLTKRQLGEAVRDYGFNLASAASGRTSWFREILIPQPDRKVK